MRLVNADVENERLLDFIAQNDSGIKYAIEHKDMTMLEDIFFDYFNGQTIAYDLDKVVEQIEKSSTDEDGIICYVDKKPVITKESAIKIVKSGGID